MPGEVLKISKRYSQPNLSYWRKTTRGGGPKGPPPSGRGLMSFVILTAITHNWVLDSNSESTLDIIIFTNCLVVLNRLRRWLTADLGDWLQVRVILLQPSPASPDHTAAALPSLTWSCCCSPPQPHLVMLLQPSPASPGHAAAALPSLTWSYCCSPPQPHLVMLLQPSSASPGHAAAALPSLTWSCCCSPPQPHLVILLQPSPASPGHAAAALLSLTWSCCCSPPQPHLVMLLQPSPASPGHAAAAPQSHLVMLLHPGLLAAGVSFWRQRQQAPAGWNQSAGGHHWWRRRNRAFLPTRAGTSSLGKAAPVAASSVYNGSGIGT